MKTTRLLRFVLMLSLALVLSMSITVFAQDGEQDTGPEPSPTGVYVTTQDFMSFREGPGSNFERLAVIDPAVTLPAYGRTSDTRWLQVMYEGQLGWVASIWLVWTGDVINLPVDGVNPVPFIRRAAALGRTTRDALYYRNRITPEDELGTIPEGTVVELTGRIGEGEAFQMQVRYENQLVWVGSWDMRIIDGDYRRLLDLAYLYPYGRLILQLEEDLALVSGSYSQSLDVWNRLDRGDQVACLPIPVRATRSLTDTDAAKERVFLPPAEALNSAVTSVNLTISAFEDACNNPNVVLTRELIDAQLNELDNAERNLILAGSLLEPLRRRNPLLSGQ
jgi:hypothetical protein